MLWEGTFCGHAPGPRVLFPAFLSGFLPPHVLRTISLAPLLPKRGSKVKTGLRLSGLLAHAAHSLYWKLLEQMDYFQIFVKKFIIHIF